MSVKQYLELLEASGIETNDKDTAKLDKLSNDDGLIERSEFLSYAKKSHVFKSLQEELEKQHYDKAELAFKVCNRIINNFLGSKVHDRIILLFMQSELKVFLLNCLISSTDNVRHW